MNSLRSIVVGIDFSPGAGAALRQAMRLAAASPGATVRAVHVINTYVTLDASPALSPLKKNIQTSLEVEARRQWLQFEAGAPGKDTIQLDVRVGNAATVLLDVASEVQADLLVLGLHREPGAEGGAGTVAGSCVRKASAPVLLVSAEQTATFKHVAACVDFTDTCHGAIREGARIARVDGGVLDILHVFEPPWKQLRYFAPMPENTPEFQAGYRAHMLSKLRDFCRADQGDLHGVTHQYKLDEHHSAGRGIAEYAANNDVDLIVMGANSKNDLRNLFLGSTAERLLKQTPCSMLTVRPPATQRS